MYIFYNAFAWCVRLADQLVFGEKSLTKVQIDLRTLACFVISSIAFLVGIGTVGLMESEFAIFAVWLITSFPLACVFIARHQRIVR